MKKFTLSSHSPLEGSSYGHLSKEIQLIQDMTDASFRDMNHDKVLEVFTKGLSEIFSGQGVAILVKEYEDSWITTVNLLLPLESTAIDQLQTQLKNAFCKYSGQTVPSTKLNVIQNPLLSQSVEPASRVEEAAPLKEWQAVPLQSGEKFRGILLVDTSMDLSKQTEEIAFLHFLIRHFCTGLTAIETHRELLITDPLTGCYNRWFMDVELANICEGSKESTTSFWFLLIDIDYFKYINDVFGHREGDLCLARLAEILRKSLRDTDHIIRMGGDEFLITLENRTLEELLTFSKKLQKNIKDRLKISADSDQKLTLSMGAVLHSAQAGSITPDRLLDRLDHALYFSKRKGRNRLTIWTPEIEKKQQAWFQGIPFPRINQSKLTDLNTELMATIEKEKSNWVTTLNMILGTKEAETSLHSIRVSRVTEFLLQYIDLPDDEKLHILRGAQLHDIGKIAIPEAILHKEGDLTESEWMIMRQHPLIGYSFVKNHSFLEKPAKIILHHHESYDGKGYPRGLKGEEIPLGARLFSLIDAYDSMRSNRVYKKSISQALAVQELKNKSGIQFDPEILQLFLQHIQQIEKIGCWQVEGKA